MKHYALARAKTDRAKNPEAFSKRPPAVRGNHDSGFEDLILIV